MAQPSPSRPASCGEVWDHADAIAGGLTQGQARLLWDEAQRLGDSPLVVEIGSHRGRSTVVLASAVKAHDGVVVAIDPFVEGRLFGGKSTQDDFESNLERVGVRDRVRHLADYSTRARPVWDSAIDLLYIDGKHDYWTLSDDLRWSEHLAAGGRILIHDCFSSIGVTLGVLAHVLPSRRLSYLGREGSMALFEVRRPQREDRARIIGELPWWLRNIFMKVLLRLRLRPIARLLGHDSPYDPY